MRKAWPPLRIAEYRSRDRNSAFDHSPSTPSRDWCQRHHSIRGRRVRNPLIVIERKSALEIRLELDHTASHIPRAVRELRIQKVLRPPLVSRVGNLQRSRLPQRV